ncbi:MAG: response regulator [Pseudomonadota bacterium]
MGQRILVVEDNELNRRLFTHVLRLADYQVLEAGDGIEALRMARHNRPELVLLDMELPRLPGLEVARRLRADPEMDGIPILAISAFVSDAAARAAREAGCIGYLRKPVGPSTMLDAVSRVLEAAAMPVEG